MIFKNYFSKYFEIFSKFTKTIRDKLFSSSKFNENGNRTQLPNADIDKEPDTEIIKLKVRIQELEHELSERRDIQWVISALQRCDGKEVSKNHRVGRPEKARQKKSVKIETSMLVLFEFARRRQVVSTDFSTFINQSLLFFFEEKYPQIYEVYLAALDLEKNDNCY